MVSHFVMQEEERKARLGPGGLDPVEVFEALPEVSQFGADFSVACFLIFNGLPFRHCKIALKAVTLLCCRRRLVKCRKRRPNIT